LIGRPQSGTRIDNENLAAKMNLSRRSLRLVREGDLVAEVAVTLVEIEAGSSPYLALEDSYKLDDVRDALRAGAIRRAARLADGVYRLAPLQTRENPRNGQA